MPHTRRRRREQPASRRQGRANDQQRSKAASDSQGRPDVSRTEPDLRAPARKSPKVAAGSSMESWPAADPSSISRWSSTASRPQAALVRRRPRDRPGIPRAGGVAGLWRTAQRSLTCGTQTRPPWCRSLRGRAKYRMPNVPSSPWNRGSAAASSPNRHEIRPARARRPCVPPVHRSTVAGLDAL